MADSRFIRFFEKLERRRRWVAGVLVAVLVLSGVALLRLRFDNTLDLMLPANSPAQRMIAFLRDANFSNKIVISLESRAQGDARAALLEATDRLAASLHPPLVTRVITGFSAPDLAADAGFFIRYAPQMLGPEDLARIDALLTPDGIRDLLRQRYTELLKPEGLFMARAIRSDPLDISRTVMDRLRSLAANMGYEVNVENGHFVSPDGRHTLLIAETSASLTDAAASRRLLAYLDSRIRTLPRDIHAGIVCGHTHVVSNEDTIKRDLGVIFSIASTAFVVLYVAFFRDIRGLLIFLMPALAAIVALALTALLFPRLSYFVIAFGPVIAGIADDYGIAAYVAVRYGRSRAEAIRHIVQPVIVGAITTTGIFFAFFFSRIPAYRQLALFCIVSIFLAVALALLVLPLCLRLRPPPEAPAPDEPDAARTRRGRLAILVLFAVFLAAAAACATRVRFDSDITRLDGVRPQIVADEQAFRKTWGTGERKEALLAVVGANPEDALERNDAIYREVSALIGTNRLVSIASLWPSTHTRAERAARWTAFWRDGREARLRDLLATQGAAFGFATNAFVPFFDHLYDAGTVAAEPATNRVLTSLKERFVQSAAGRTQILSYFPDDPALVASLSAKLRERPGVFVVSRAAVGAALSSAFTGEMWRISLLAGILIVLTALIFLRSVWLTLIALAPAFTGVLGLLGGLALLNCPLNVANLISGIVVFGLCIDFGVHILHAWQHRESRATRMAITFAAVTTLIGAGVLLFARHPALYSIGLTLVIGVGLGYVAAMWVVPALCEFLPDNGRGTTSASPQPP
jgi:predicted exporter